MKFSPEERQTFNEEMALALAGKRIWMWGDLPANVVLAMLKKHGVILWAENGQKAAWRDGI
jgi:hypothetical protein